MGEKVQSSLRQIRRGDRYFYVHVVPAAGREITGPTVGQFEGNCSQLDGGTMDIRHGEKLSPLLEGTLLRQSNDRLCYRRSGRVGPV